MFSFELVFLSLFSAELFLKIRSKCIFFCTSGKGYRTSVIEYSGKPLLPAAYLVFAELDVPV